MPDISQIRYQARFHGSVEYTDFRNYWPEKIGPLKRQMGRQQGTSRRTNYLYRAIV